MKTKLTLNSETLRALTADTLDVVRGGIAQNAITTIPTIICAAPRENKR